MSRKWKKEEKYTYISTRFKRENVMENRKMAKKKTRTTKTTAALALGF
jgi:hypothetical protein